MKAIFNQCLAAALLALSATAQAADLKAMEIVQKAEIAAYYAGDDGRSQARLLIVDAQNRKQKRQFTILRKDTTDAGQQDFLVFFDRPADVRGTVFRVAKQDIGDDDRWLFLPGLDLVKRISAGDKRTSFVGSHFYYEDVSGRDPAEDNHRLLSHQDGRYLIESKPKKPETVEFARYVVSIDDSHFLPMQIRYFDRNDKLIRQVEAIEVKTVQGKPTVVKSKISDFNAGGYTLMQFRKVEYDLGLPQNLFSERSMRKVPVKYLK